jgi:hypothetical protein
MRLSTLLSLTCVAALGCHADTTATPQAVAPADVEIAAAPTPTAVEQGAAARPSPPVAMTRPVWRWNHYGPEAVRRGAHERRAVELGPSTISLEVGVKPERIVVKRAMKEQGSSALWTYTLEDAPFVTGAALLLVPSTRVMGSTPPLPGQRDLVVLAAYSRISSGCELIALDAETGALRWRSALTALGPVKHSKYRNEVQLDVISGQIVVYGYEASGRYIEVVDRETGRTLHNISPKGGHAWAEWGTMQDAAGREAVREELEASWSEGVKAAGVGRVIAMLSGTGPSWSVMLGNTQDDREFEVAVSEERPFMPAQVAAHIDSVAILYAGGSAGRLVQLNGATGKERWSTPLVGLGAASADLKQRVTPWTDSFVVTSEGAQGAALEIIDISSGQPIWHERWFN